MHGAHGEKSGSLRRGESCEYIVWLTSKFDSKKTGRSCPTVLCCPDVQPTQVILGDVFFKGPSIAHIPTPASCRAYVSRTLIGRVTQKRRIARFSYKAAHINEVLLGDVVLPEALAGVELQLANDPLQVLR